MMRLALPLLLAACTPEPTTPDTDAPADTDGTTEVDDTDEPTTSSAPSCDGITPAVTELTVPELADMLDAKDFELINVHVPDEGQIPGTDVHIAYTDVDALEDHLQDDLARRVVVYCKTGPMSAIASADLVDRGYCNVFDLPDGMIGWEAQGYPIE
jgi:rhodanese-related sulfurtransferase